MYEITSEGGDVRAKFFRPVETAGGVTAYPWNGAHGFAGAFMSGGRLGKRVPLHMGGVFNRIGTTRLPIQATKTGLFIPEEMTKGQTLDAFKAGTGQIADVVVRRLGALIR